MIEILIIIAFIAWYIGSLIISETFGKTRKIGVEWSFFISMIFSPLIGFFVTYFGKKEMDSEA